MIEVAAVTMILAAWAVPALFLLVVASLLTFTLMRPLYLAWDAVLRRVGNHVASVLGYVAERLAVRSHAFAVRHRGH